jgi:chromosome partitioning protein
MKIAVVSSKGGVGKSTLCVELACEFARRGVDVSIHDHDFKQKTVSEWHKIGKRNTPKLDSAAVLELTDIQPSLDAKSLQNAIKGADIIIVPVGPSGPDLWATRDTLELIKEAKKSRVMIVRNKVVVGTRMQKVLAKADAPFDVAKTEIGYRQDFIVAMSTGKSAAELDDASKAASEIRALVDEIVAKFITVQMSVN